MKTNIFAMILMTCCATFVTAQEAAEKPAEKAGAEEMQFPKPTAEHSVLKKDVGTWDADITMMSPEGEQKSKGVEKVRMMGDFWSISNFDYEFMGQKVHGHGVIGYDPIAKKYTGSWHDSMMPWPSAMVGTYDKDAKKFSFSMKGKSMDGKKVDNYKIEISYPADNKKTFVMYMQMPGGEFTKMLNIDYTKK